jgi:curli production assembly/transport component CsgG
MKELPAPREKIVAAVYQFRDQTGQYKPSEVGASWSTAVTQGATSILLQSLEESGWFVPIEREGLANLLNERRLIRSSREQYEGGNAQGQSLLPPLLFGGITLEGGIISYESNIVTGGAGLRYFGAGASGEYRENKVTVYLRAVSTSNGRILKTVHTSKTILSQKVSAGLFRFVSLKRLLEAETGYTFNEPSHMAVQEAIDKAVYSLIIEGIMEGLWSVADPDDKEHEAIKEYQKEKEMNYDTDYLGMIFQEDLRANTSIGMDAGLSQYDGDYGNAVILPAAEISLGFLQNRSMSVALHGGIGRVESADIFYANFAHAGLDLQYRLFNNYLNGSPYVRLGGGVMYHTQGTRFERSFSFDKNLIPFVNMGFGYEWLLGEKGAVSLSVNNRQLISDDIDGMVNGRYNDRVLSVDLGVKLYFNFLRR